MSGLASRGRRQTEGRFSQLLRELCSPWWWLLCLASSNGLLVLTGGFQSIWQVTGMLAPGSQGMSQNQTTSPDKVSEPQTLKGDLVCTSKQTPPEPANCSSVSARFTRVAASRQDGLGPNHTPREGARTAAGKDGRTTPRYSDAVVHQVPEVTHRQSVGL